jgi:hypothetical protein
MNERWSRMLRHVIRYTDTSVTEKAAATIFRVILYNFVQDEKSGYLRNFSTNLPNYIPRALTIA